MIIHFIKQDFKTDHFYWLLYFLIVITIFVSGLARHSPEILLGISLILPASRIHSIFGSAIRNRAVMSKNYLLSLPVSRRKLFNVNLVRAAIYFFPLIIVQVLAPIEKGISKNIAFTFSTAIFVGSLLLMVGSNFGAELHAKHKDRLGRMILLFKSVLVTAIWFSPFLIAILIYAIWSLTLIPLLIAALSLVPKYTYSSKKWAGC